jgi:TolA-binding protein
MALEKKMRGYAEPLPQKRGSDLTALALHIRDHWQMYAAAAAVIVVAAFAGMLYNVARTARTTEVATAYVKALEEQEPAARLAALEKVEADGTPLEAELKYMIGEAAYDAGQIDKAEAAFQAVIDSGDDTFAAPALEGLGYIREDQGKNQEALELYQRIQREYTRSATAERQLLNIGRVQEKLGNFEEAEKAYSDALTLFAQSSVVANAQEALDKLRAAHPELAADDAALAPETPAPAAPAAPAPAPETPAPVEAPAETPAPEAPAAEAPAVEAPEAEAPAGEAPADEAAEAEAPAAESTADEAPAAAAPADEAPATEAPEAEASATEAPAAEDAPAAAE